MDPLVAALDTLVNLVMPLGISFAASFIKPHSWRRSAFVLGLCWGLIPALVTRVQITLFHPLLFFLAEGGLFQLKYWSGPTWSFLYVAWPLLVLAVASLGSFAGNRARLVLYPRKRERGYE